MADPFIGQIMAVGFNFAPRGWAKCEGQLLSISSNSALFSLLGTTYGGDGRTTFGLPDLRGRVAISPGTGGGLPTYRWGERGGTPTNQMTANEMPSHNHGLVAKEEGDSDDPQGNFIAGNGLPSFGTSADKTLNTGAIGNTGGGQAQNNMQPYLAIYYVIALVGIFPSRN